MKLSKIAIPLITTFSLYISACGREAGRALRQGQLPVFDFPIYLTEGAPGKVWKIDKDRNKTLLAEGLMDPRGVVTDRFQNVYVAEYGAGRVLKFPAGKSAFTVLAEGLSSPSVVATDSFGEVYVAQDGVKTVSRLSDHKLFGSYSSVASALAFGVDDIPLVGLFNEDKVFWSWTNDGPTASIESPNNIAIDGTGRVYVAKADPLAGEIHRYNQREPGEGQVVANNLLGPTGIAIDLVGNMFVVEQGANRIVLVTDDGKKFEWLTGIMDGQYLAFTQY
jgi:sugar lactone lactonase YvrE